MKRIATIALLASAAASFASVANATTCTDTPQAQWMTIEAMTAKAVEAGFEVRKVKIEDNCYEVYGIKDGKKVEAYFHPVTAELVKQKIDD